jgi:hypothetical protein
MCPAPPSVTEYVTSDSATALELRLAWQDLAYEDQVHFLHIFSDNAPAGRV